MGRASTGSGNDNVYGPATQDAVEDPSAGTPNDVRDVACHHVDSVVGHPCLLLDAAQYNEYSHLYIRYIIVY